MVESINSKLNLYLPKKVPNNYSFVNNVSKVLINDNIKDYNNYRKDYKTRALINLLEDLDFNNNNNNLHWITFMEISKYVN